MSDATPDALTDDVARDGAALWPGSSLTSFTTMPGGHSGITCLAEFDTDHGHERLVIKAAPLGRPAVGRHDVLRQARILQALGRVQAAGVPEVLLRHEGDQPFFAMRWYPGVSAEPVLGETPGLAADIISRRAFGAARALAALHAIEPAALQHTAPELASEPVLAPLEEFGRWTATMAAVDPELSEGADAIAQALRSAPPSPVPPRIVHGDFRLGNLLCRGDDTMTIIDWEIWSLGDPRVDLGWLLLFCDAANFPGVSENAPMPPGRHLRAAYEQAGAGPLTQVAWFEAMARYKMAAVMGNNLGRHRAGRHHDPYQEKLVPTIRYMIESASRMLAATDRD